MRRHLATSVRSIILLVGAICVGLITTHVIQIRLDRGQEENETKTELLNMTTALANFTGQTFGTVDQGLSRFSANLELSTPPGVVHETLRAARDSSLAIREIFVTDADGNLLSASYSLSPESRNLANEPPFMTPPAQGEKTLRISPPLTGYLGRGTGETILRLARPRLEADGTFSGWIVGTLNVDHFRRMFNSLSVTPHTVIGLFRSDGVLLTSNVNETYGVIGPGTREGLFRKHLGNGAASGAFWSDEDSVERSLIVYTRVPDLPLILVAATPEEEVYADWQARALTASLIVLALAAFIVTATMVAIRTLQLRQREQIEMTRRLDALALASVELTRERSRDRVLSRTAAIARELVPSHQCVVSLTLAEDASQQVHTVSLSEKYGRWRDYDEQSDGSGIYRLVCETNKPMRLSQSELEEHPAWLGFGASSERHPPMRGWLAVPLIAQDRSNLGLIQLSDRNTGDFDEQDQAMLVQLAQIVSASVENINLLEARSEALAAAEAARDEIGRIFAAMSDGVFHLDRDWRFTRVNAAFERMSARGEDELVCRSIWEVYPEVGSSNVRKHFEDALEKQQPVTFETHYAPRDRDYLIRLFPVEDGLAAYVTDMTDRRRAEKQLQQAQKMEAVGQLTGGIAHDFNNLLTVIMGNTDMLIEQTEDRDDLRSLAELIDSAALRGADLTHRLLAFSRRQPLEPRAVDVNQLILNLEGLLRRTLRENIELEMVRGAGLWRAVVDPTQLESAVLNIAINARDAMPEGGKLTIETANARLDDAYAASQDEVRAGQYVMIGLSDSGSGMSEETMARAFDPFFTTKAVGKGSGLGLSMVYGFVKQSGGHVKLYSERGLGTTVKLYLPRATASQEAGPSPPQRGEAVPRGSERVAIVEDEQLVRHFAAANLQELGYQVASFATGPELLQAMEGGLEFDLLFTDVVLPGGLNGRDIADAVKRRLPAVKVLYSSGYTDNAIVHHGRLDQGVHLLSKPFRKADLAHKVRAVLDGG